MNWMIILFLISLIINGIIAYILHNSHYDKRYGGDPFKLPLIMWILAGIVTIIPVLNIIATIFFISLIIRAYSSMDIVTNDDFWLTKEY